MHGLMIAIPTETHMLKKMVVQVSTLLQLELESSAKVSHKEDLEVLHKRKLIALLNYNRLQMPGLMIAIQIETHLLKLTVVQVLILLLKELELSVKDLLKENQLVLFKRNKHQMLGLMIATQIEMFQPKQTQVQEFTLFQELELNAKDSHRRENQV